MKLTLSQLPALYINMDDATERAATFTSELSGLGYNNVTRISAEPNNDGVPYSGIAKSNAKALHAAESYPFILFEDDARPFNYKNAIDVPDDADAVYLGLVAGFVPLGSEPVDGYSGVYKVQTPFGIHAVVYVTKEYADAAEAVANTVATGQYGDLAKSIVDVAYTELSNDFNIYAVDPLFYQHNENDPRMSNLSRVTSIANGTIDPIAYDYAN
jgi:hypothetical protein